MPRVSCRCGEKLRVRPDSPDRIECPRCGARIRLRRAAPPEGTAGTGDGYLRFHCPCGRRLKVPAEERPQAGKCPDCGRVVPVPVTARATGPSPTAKNTALNDPDMHTEEMDSDDLARLERWAARHQSRSARAESTGTSTPAFIPVVSASEANANVGSTIPTIPPPSVVKFEAGLRVCPRCQKPVHLGTSVCRACGTPVPRR
jgi:hypothetical protein